VRYYQEWCTARGLEASAAALTLQSAVEFIASYAEESNRTAGTLRVYRSALSTWWAEALQPGTNPLQHPLFTRLMDGIARDKRPTEAARRAATPVTISLTPVLLAEMERMGAGARGTPPEDLMRWAACNLGTYALLRPGEFLGVHKDRGSALRADSVTFFAADGSQRKTALHPHGTDVDLHPFPDRFSVALGATKADQAGKNKDVVVAAPPAVAALWRWVHMRRDCLSDDDELFRVPGSLPLSQAALTRHIAFWCAAVTGDATLPKVTGRCFRRGGASGLMAAGASDSDIQAQGRWRSAAMPAVYSDAASQEQRRVSVSRAMAPVLRC